MSLLTDELLSRLRQEAKDWHLTQTGVIVRHTSQVVNGRDTDVPTVVYTGALGIKKEKAEGTQVTLELPADAPHVMTGDVVHVDHPVEGRVFPLYVVLDEAPATENVALLKLRCEARVRAPKTEA